jgi:hypothetical protein
MIKNIEINEETKKLLQYAADKNKWSLKRYIEVLLQVEAQKILKRVVSKNNTPPTQ